MNEAEILFTKILDCDRLSLYLNREYPLSRENSAFVSSVLKRRISGEPIQYILGYTEFMGLEFKVDKSVFIPRPETEILVETAIKIGHRLLVVGDRLRVLDLGTGSGCIAISLAKLLPNAKIDAVDISFPALEVARENALLNKVSVDFLQGDLFNTYRLSPIAYRLIISNPPYIASEDIKNLQPEIKYEPAIALDGAEDGLDFYRKIIHYAPSYLEQDGLLIMEIGFNQKGEIKKLFQKSADFEITDIVKDYNNIDRVVVARKISEGISYGAQWIN
jgi:release factor glutamine methyltransferase